MADHPPPALMPLRPSARQPAATVSGAADKRQPSEGEPLLRLHTDAIQDENDVAMACDC